MRLIQVLKKRRRRSYIRRQMFPLARRPVVVAVATLALYASVAYAHTVGETAVKTGRWNGITWKFTAQTGSDGSYCIAMTVRGREEGRSCGELGNDGITYFAHSGRPAPNYVLGVVIARARSVRITFFNGRSIRTSTIPPPPPLDRGTRFFAAILPCRPEMPRSFVARNAAGRIVAQLVRRRGGPKLSC
jgi:hypothetical protein